MAVNYDLHYLLSGLYIDAAGYLVPEKRAELSDDETRKLQTFSELYPDKFNGYIKRAFCNKGTFELHKNVRQVKYQDCFSSTELKLIEAIA